MPVILIANPKGGVGKSTVSTNLAGYFAHAGYKTMLGDLDVQQSALSWLKVRPQTVPKIYSWDYSAQGVAQPPQGVTHVVLDAPAGVGGRMLKETLMLADRVIVPLQPSLFDIYATEKFLRKLTEHGVTKESGQCGVLGMRVDARTLAAEQLQRFVDGVGLPVLGMLRNTQIYVQLAAQGLTLWDVAPGRVDKDLTQWEDMLRWLEKS